MLLGWCLHESEVMVLDGKADMRSPMFLHKRKAPVTQQRCSTGA